MHRQYFIYIMTNKYNNVLYTGITSDLERRIYEHKTKEIPGFTSRYGINKLVYFEVFEEVNDAIVREKQIKGGSRRKKLLLVDRNNEGWFDLAHNL